MFDNRDMLAMKVTQEIQSHFDEANVILYDGDCLYCQKYVEYLRLQETLGTVVLKNLREHSAIITLLREHQIEPNEGMVFVLGDNLYWGDEAVYALARLSTPSNTFNKLQKAVLSRRGLSRALYPAMKFFRGITLKLRGKEYIP